MTTSIRDTLPPLPERMRALPVSDKGYPVPFFVARVDGKPDFRIVDDKRFALARRFGLCWICGEPLGKFRTFALGPLGALNRINSEPGSHHDCATFAAKACPFLILPRAQRRTAHLPDEARMHPAMVEHNPGMVVLWTTTRDAEQWRASAVVHLTAEPVQCEWFTEGRPATRAEIDDCIAANADYLREHFAPLSDDEQRILAARLAVLRKTVERTQP